MTHALDMARNDHGAQVPWDGSEQGKYLGIQSCPVRTEHQQGNSSQQLEKELMAMPGGKWRSPSMRHVLAHSLCPAP